ncbi:MAG: hypothetical protein R2711_00730 [Acidimicrobiales bacterium]
MTAPPCCAGTYNEPSGAFRKGAERCTEAAEGRYRIETVDLPNNADEQRRRRWCAAWRRRTATSTSSAWT